MEILWHFKTPKLKQGQMLLLNMVLLPVAGEEVAEGPTLKGRFIAAQPRT